MFIKINYGKLLLETFLFEKIFEILIKIAPEDDLLQNLVRLSDELLLVSEIKKKNFYFFPVPVVRYSTINNRKFHIYNVGTCTAQSTYTSNMPKASYRLQF